MKKRMISLLLSMICVLMLCGCESGQRSLLEQDRLEAFNNGGACNFYTNGEWLYYIDYSKGDLYKMKEKDLSEKQFVMTIDPYANGINSHLISSVHYADGLIYNRLNEERNETKLYYVIDGTNIENEVLSETDDFIIDSSGIYFISQNEICYSNAESLKEIFSKTEEIMNENVNEYKKKAKKICEIPDVKEISWGYYAILEDYFYLLGVEKNNSETMWKVDSQGKMIERVTSTIFDEVATTDYIDGDYIINCAVYNNDGIVYSVAANDFGKFELWIMDFNGMQKMRLTGAGVKGTTVTGNANKIVFCQGNINAVENYVFFVDATTGNLCRINSDGTNCVVLQHSECGSLNIVDDYLYYKNFDEGTWCRMSFDGNVNEIVMYY